MLAEGPDCHDASDNYTQAAHALWRYIIAVADAKQNPRAGSGKSEELARYRGRRLRIHMVIAALQMVILMIVIGARPQPYVLCAT